MEWGDKPVPSPLAYAYGINPFEMPVDPQLAPSAPAGDDAAKALVKAAGPNGKGNPRTLKWQDSTLRNMICLTHPNGTGKHEMRISKHETDQNERNTNDQNGQSPLLPGLFRILNILILLLSRISDFEFRIFTVIVSSWEHLKWPELSTELSRDGIRGRYSDRLLAGQQQRVRAQSSRLSGEIQPRRTQHERGVCTQRGGMAPFSKPYLTNSSTRLRRDRGFEGSRPGPLAECRIPMESMSLLNPQICGHLQRAS